MPKLSPGLTVGPAFIESFVNASGSNLQGVTTMTERYIVNPIAADEEYFDNFDNFDISKVPLNLLNQRLSLLVSTFWQTGFAPMYQNSGLVPDNDWQVNWPALPARSGTRRPLATDILGFASSIVRQSKYVKSPDGGSAMGGPERARMMCDLEVMLQDVRAGNDVGKIALGSVTETTQRLKRDRLYK
ncbi:hypothetical protein MMC18_006122 [Xylographa bjoerkii]|nr:hypothetical protein [Xylographa bjoerkii]